MRRGALAVAVMFGVSACGGGLVNGLFTRGTLAYRVAEPPEAEWRRMKFEDNDLAWINRSSGHVLAMNALCEGHEDPSLEVLTNHLLIGFTERKLLSRERLQLDGREALRSKYRAKLDGVEVGLDLVVLKKNGCVHDFTYVSPAGLEDAHRQRFDAMLAAFRQERSP
jgi:hypothetical protein